VKNICGKLLFGDLVEEFVVFQVFMTTSIINSQKLSDEPSNSDFRLKDIVKTLPRECFEQNRRQAWTQVLLSVLAVALGYYSLL
jgi:acyl-lipid omega-6 desaturase (Delta-12 desaturase)